MRDAQLLSLADMAVELAERQGAAAAEAFLTQNRNVTVRLQEGEIDSLKHSLTAGVGIRLLRAGRPGYAYTSDLSPEGLARVVAGAWENAQYTSPDPSFVLPAPSGKPPEIPGLVHPAFDAIDTPARVEVLRRIADAALRRSPDNTRILRNHYGDDRTEVAVANSMGLRVSYSTALAYAWVELVVQRGERLQTGNSFTFGHALDELEPERVGTEAAAQALALVGARPVPTQQVPVIIAPAAAVNILTQIARMLSAEAVQKGRSLFRDLLGQQVAAPAITLVDDPTLAGGLASRPVDAEGVPSRRTQVVEGGVLHSFLHNCSTALRAGTVSTGHASRVSYRSIPVVGSTNFMLLPGHETPADLMRRAWRGFHVVELMGMHAINPITGRFSAAARGFWVEGGEPGAPVAEVTISGEYLSLLKQVEAVGSDLRFYPGSNVIGSPSLLIPDVMVSGL